MRSEEEQFLSVRFQTMYATSSLFDELRPWDIAQCHDIVQLWDKWKAKIVIRSKNVISHNRLESALKIFLTCSSKRAFFLSGSFSFGLRNVADIVRWFESVFRVKARDCR